MKSNSSRQVRFADFEFDCHSGDLRRDSTSLKLQPQPAKVLAVLIQHAGEIVSRQELAAEVWGSDTFVDFEQGFVVDELKGPFGSAERHQSVGTPTEGVGTAKGTVLPADTYPSKIFNDNFVYQIFVPAQYKAGTPAALMIFQDGGNYTGNFKAPRVFDNVIKDGTVPVTITVYIDPTGQRGKELEGLVSEQRKIRVLAQFSTMVSATPLP